MRGVSRTSLVDLRKQLDGIVDRARAKAALDALDTLGAELAGVVDLLDAQPVLRRALTDPGREGTDRAALAQRLLSGHVGKTALDLATAAASASWSSPRDVADAIDELAVAAEVGVADRRGRLDDTEDEIFRFGRVAASDPALRLALTDRAAGADQRRALVRRLLDGKVTPESLRLLERVAAAPRGRSLEAALQVLQDTAARRRDRTVALVRSAVALSAEQQERLARALSAQVSRDVHVNVVVEPGLVGGLRVEIGDEVIDGTVVARLEEARRRLAG